MGLKPGEKVRVKEFKEIARTLDTESRYEGMLFGKEMIKHCGATYIVLKQVNKIIDYYKNGVRIFRDTYILDGVHCYGTEEYPECDRMCFIFWKEKWLEKTDLLKVG